MVLAWKLARATALAGALFVPGAAMAQDWSGGDYHSYGARGDYDGSRGGYDQDRGGSSERRGDRDAGGRGGWSDDRVDRDRRGWDDGRQNWNGGRGGDYDRRGWDGDRRQGWGGGYGPGPGGQRWWHGRWWSYGAGPCWRWSQWRQNWTWVCD